MENRNGRLVDGRVSEASGTAESNIAKTMLARAPGRHRITVGADKGFDTADFVAALGRLEVTTHVARKTRPTAARRFIGRIIRHANYAISQRIRKRIEEAFGWIKKIALQRLARHRGKEAIAVICRRLANRRFKP